MQIIIISKHFHVQLPGQSLLEGLTKQTLSNPASDTQCFLQPVADCYTPPRCWRLQDWQACVVHRDHSIIDSG
jgi:hypothetical protein